MRRRYAFSAAGSSVSEVSSAAGSSSAASAGSSAGRPRLRPRSSATGSASATASGSAGASSTSGSACGRCLGGCLGFGFGGGSVERGLVRLGLGARGGQLGGRLAQLADARLLADLLAQVVELGAVDVADRADLDLLDLRRVHRERPLDADAERLLADGERLARAGALALDHDPLEDLDAAALALDHLEVDADGVARLEAGNVLAQLTLLDALDDRAHGKGVGLRPAANGSENSANGNAVRRPVGREDLADQVLARHRPPLARVAGLRAVVAHHEVLPRAGRCTSPPRACRAGSAGCTARRAACR